jgi:hypothetical protein
MNEEKDFLNGLAQRIVNAFVEAENDAIADLSENDGRYKAMRREMLRLREAYPAVGNVLECGGAIILSVEEHEALLRYLDLKRRTLDRERMRLCFLGCKNRIVRPEEPTKAGVDSR